MAYLALYRKWRPGQFHDIVGQEHVSKTLKNALLQNRIAHAYLFCGPRGTGKTSSAKVFAKGVNCLQPIDGEPCNECTNCEKINTGSSLDVFEIDAASNRGVDEIRDLRERVKFAPTEGRYKIYIIDEVHMLTTEAFNALLKTLEEPPQNIVFILATTEPHKIPLTILSRCQRFDFRPIEMGRILARLEYICQESNLTVETEALKLIAKAAEGGMRDALSTLDQCISLGENKVVVDDVNAILGTVNEELLYRLIENIAVKNIDQSLQIVDVVAKAGKDLQHFIKDLIGGFRNLLIININQNRDDLIIASAEVLNLVKDLAAKISKREIMSIVDILTDTEKEMKWSNQPRLMLEVAIIKSCSLTQEIDLSSLIEKVEELELKLKTIKEQGLPQESLNKINKPSKPLRKTDSALKEVELGACDQDTLAEVRKHWPQLLDFLRKKDKMQVQAFLIESEPIHFSDQTLVLAFEHSFHKDQVELPRNREIVEEVLAKGLKKPVSIRCLLKSQLKESAKHVEQETKDNLVQDVQSFFGPNVEIQVQD